MAETKTRPTDVKPKDFIDAVEHPVRRADGHALLKLMQKISGKKPVMWGPTIVGFGQYHYVYDSGHEGDICRIGFSPRSGHLVLYISRDFPEAQALMPKLGKHKDKGCLYINKLADVDMDVLEKLIAASWAHSLRTHPE
jgi:hypothetical protein